MADVWTEGIDAGEYTRFILGLIGLLTRNGGWRPLEACVLMLRLHLVHATVLIDGTMVVHENDSCECAICRCSYADLHTLMNCNVAGDDLSAPGQIERANLDVNGRRGGEYQPGGSKTSSRKAHLDGSISGRDGSSSDGKRQPDSTDDHAACGYMGSQSGTASAVRQQRGRNGDQLNEKQRAAGRGNDGSYGDKSHMGSDKSHSTDENKMKSIQCSSDKGGTGSNGSGAAGRDDGKGTAGQCDECSSKRKSAGVKRQHTFKGELMSQNGVVQSAEYDDSLACGADRAWRASGGMSSLDSTTTAVDWSDREKTATRSTVVWRDGRAEGLLNEGHGEALDFVPIPATEARSKVPVWEQVVDQSDKEQHDSKSQRGPPKPARARGRRKSGRKQQANNMSKAMVREEENHQLCSSEGSTQQPRAVPLKEAARVNDSHERSNNDDKQKGNHGFAHGLHSSEKASVSARTAHILPPVPVSNRRQLQSAVGRVQSNAQHVGSPTWVQERDQNKVLLYSWRRRVGKVSRMVSGVEGGVGHSLRPYCLQRPQAQQHKERQETAVWLSQPRLPNRLKESAAHNVQPETTNEPQWQVPPLPTQRDWHQLVMSQLTPEQTAEALQSLATPREGYNADRLIVIHQGREGFSGSFGTKPDMSPRVWKHVIAPSPSPRPLPPGANLPDSLRRPPHVHRKVQSLGSPSVDHDWTVGSKTRVGT